MMSCKVYMLLLIVLVDAGLTIADVTQKLYLSVYYESKCADSKKFVLEQLQPAFRILSEYLMLRLVPFGKAQSIGYGDFQCQHGPEECLGNIIQECALLSMKNSTDLQKVDYVACEMSNLASIQGDLQCVEQAKVSPSEVELCVASGLGASLQMDSEYVTKLVRPSFIPTVTVDGIVNEQLHEDSLVDLPGTLCTFLKDSPQCGRYYNDIALQYVLELLSKSLKSD